MSSVEIEKLRGKGIQVNVLVSLDDDAIARLELSRSTKNGKTVEMNIERIGWPLKEGAADGLSAIFEYPYCLKTDNPPGPSSLELVGGDEWV